MMSPMTITSDYKAENPVRSAIRKMGADCKLPEKEVYKILDDSYKEMKREQSDSKENQNKNKNQDSTPFLAIKNANEHAVKWLLENDIFSVSQDDIHLAALPHINKNGEMTEPERNILKKLLVSYFCNLFNKRTDILDLQLGNVTLASIILVQGLAKIIAEELKSRKEDWGSEIENAIFLHFKNSNMRSVFVTLNLEAFQHKRIDLVKVKNFLNTLSRYLSNDSLNPYQQFLTINEEQSKLVISIRDTELVEFLHKNYKLNADVALEQAVDLEDWVMVDKLLSMKAKLNIPGHGVFGDQNTPNAPYSPILTKMALAGRIDVVKKLYLLGARFVLWPKKFSVISLLEEALKENDKPEKLQARKRIYAFLSIIHAIQTLKRRAYLDHSKDLLDQDREDLLNLISLSKRSDLESFRVAIQNELDSNHASFQKLSNSPKAEVLSAQECAADSKSSPLTPSAPLVPSLEIEGLPSAPPADLLSSSVSPLDISFLELPRAPVFPAQSGGEAQSIERKIVTPSLTNHAFFFGIPRKDPMYELLIECAYGDWKGNIVLQKKMMGIASKLIEARSRLEGEIIDLPKVRSLLAQ